MFCWLGGGVDAGGLEEAVVDEDEIGAARGW